jgi:hypothetical protein
VADTLINNTKALEDYITFLRSSFDKHKTIKVSVKSAKTRTLTQNRSIHKYCAQLAEAFNDAGLDMNQVLAEGTSIPWSEEKVKSDIWKVVQLAAIGKESTTKLEANEVSKVYDIVNRHISQTFGIFIPWPCRDTLINKSQGE